MKMKKMKQTVRFTEEQSQHFKQYETDKENHLVKN